MIFKTQKFTIHIPGGVTNAGELIWKQYKEYICAAVLEKYRHLLDIQYDKILKEQEKGKRHKTLVKTFDSASMGRPTRGEHMDFMPKDVFHKLACDKYFNVKYTSEMKINIIKQLKDNPKYTTVSTVRDTRRRRIKKTYTIYWNRYFDDKWKLELSTILLDIPARLPIDSIISRPDNPIESQILLERELLDASVKGKGMKKRKHTKKHNKNKKSKKRKQKKTKKRIIKQNKFNKDNNLKKNII